MLLMMINYKKSLQVDKKGVYKRKCLCYDKLVKSIQRNTQRLRNIRVCVHKEAVRYKRSSQLMAFLDFRKLLKKDLIRNKHKIQPLEQQAAMDAGSFEGFYYTFF